jgi:DNA-binding winged helix-turn-helix (wHTH) protein/tetratricopeptide (TPR) repeat protein
MVYRFGDCTLDTQQHRLERGGQPRRLRSKALQMLLYLLEHRDRTVLKQELCEQIWPQSFISEATLESTLRTVRQAIGDSGRAQEFIQTVYSYGYRFIAAVEVGADFPHNPAGDAFRSLPRSASTPSPDEDFHVALVSRVSGSATWDHDRRAPGMSYDGEAIPQQVAAELAPERPSVPSPVWEQKPVAVLAVELTFPTAAENEDVTYEPWTVASRWEQAIVEKVQGLGGIILQRSPSLLLVAFGIPLTLEQLPQRVVQAALTLRDLVVEGADHKDCPALRLAVHWGPLLVDVQATDPTAQLRAIGETLAWPVRLLGQAAPGEILLSPEIGPLVEGWCDLQVRQVPLQHGQPGRISVYAVVGTSPQWPRLGLHGRRRLSPFVGREPELAMLGERQRRVEAGQGQLVGMIGEPGVGKSRLCSEFICSDLVQSWVVLETQATAYGQATPYRPIIDLLKGYFRLDDRDAPPIIRDKVAAKLQDRDDTLKPITPACLALLEVPVEDPQWQAIDASQRRQRTLDAIKRLLVWESQRHPLLLIVENLHWIDAETQAVLDTLVESLPAAHLFLLTTYRPEYHHSWGNKTAYTQLRLDPLPRERACELVSSLLGDDATLPPLVQILIERTEGNPFFLEESIRTLVDAQVLIGERGAYRLGQALASMQLPATVQAVLAARIDRLPPEEKQLLQTAAVIGIKVPFPLLQAIAEVPEATLHDSLAYLQAAEFLYETRLFPDYEYTFTHALTREVAYGSLLHERRRALHRQIVEALEALYPDRLEEYVERLAQHALQGEVWEKAVRYCRQAGEKARHRGAIREAVIYYEQTFDVLGHLPEHPDTQTLAVELHHRLGAMLSMVGEYQRSLALLGEAAAQARQLGDRARLGGALSRIVTVHGIVGDVDGALAAGQEALEQAAALGDLALHVHASYRLGQVYANTGDYRRAAEVLRGNVAALTCGMPGNMRVWCVKSQAWLAQVLSLLGEFADGRRHGEEALRLSMRDGQWQNDAPIVAHTHLGCLHLVQGDLEAAMRVFEEGLALCRATIQRISPGTIVGGLGEAYALTGRLEEGLALLEEARQGDLRTGALGGAYVTHLRQLSAVYLRAGRLDEARQHACHSLGLARERKARGEEVRALFQLGAVHAHASPHGVQQAEAYYQQALALADELGMRPLQAHCDLGLGTLYAKIGRPVQARVALSTALDLYRSMDMTFWLPETEAILAQIRESEPSERR